MVKTKFKRAVSLVMAAVLSLGVFTNIGTTAYAASGTKSDVYIMQLPRSGDTNNNGKWGHGELKFMNGWYSHAISTDSLRASREWIWKMTSHYDCPFVLRLGHRRLVKRRAFDEYIKRFDFIE